MSDETPQLYLIAPAVLDPADFPETLARVLDAVPVACLRLALAEADEDAVARAADALREVAHARDVPLVIDSHLALVERLGLDGVHLRDGARSVRRARTELGSDGIVGAHCGASRHEGLTAGEAGADYVAFGPVRATGLGDGTMAEAELFGWWSEMIEVPVVAEGAFDLDTARALAGMVDFVALGPEIWTDDDPAAALAAYAAALSG